MTHAVEIGLKWIEGNPDDLEIRELVLGMTARKVDRKIQIRVYDVNAQWLGSLDNPDPGIEYMIGRLGIRAGIARRAIPLLERTIARSEGDLKNHARLWLGSAYRVAEAYVEARQVWQSVKDEGDREMMDRADRNLQSLEKHLQEKFPKGFPPPDERPVRKRPPERSMERLSEGSPKDRPRQDFARTQPRTDKPSGAGTSGGFRGEPRKPRPEGEKRLPRRSGDQPRRPPQTRETPQKTGATLGDLFRMKGLDLSNLAEPKKDTKKK